VNAIIDALKGFPEVINSVFPETQIQACIVHSIRNSLDSCSWKERKPVAKELKAVYRAADAEAAAAALKDFEDGAWGQRLSAITALWRLPPGRAQNDLHDAIESLNAKLHRSVRIRGHSQATRRR
jgi:transposase-like protein